MPILLAVIHHAQSVWLCVLMPQCPWFASLLDQMELRTLAQLQQQNVSVLAPVKRERSSCFF
jgi:hypothetical protein